MHIPITEKRFYPYPPPGLSLEAFKKVSANGFGDPYNAYAHSMAWYRGALYVGTTRANLCMLKVSKLKPNIRIWPVDCPEDLYTLDMRAQIWRYSAKRSGWQRVYVSPMIRGKNGRKIPRDMGYRGMCVFKGESDRAPALYVAGFASKNSDGAVILRTEDGRRFQTVADAGSIGQAVTSIRTLAAFKGRLFTSPTGKAEGNINTAGRPIIYESSDPISKTWTAVNVPAFGDPENVVVFELATCGDFLYAGTGNPRGFQLWRTTAEGKPPYRWEKILTEGAYRGPLNQCAACIQAFRGDLYLGTAIQHGGIDHTNQTGPAAPELIRIRPDGSWDLIVGQSRQTPEGIKEPLSGFFPGFNNFFNGYFWTMAVHQGWLYVGSFDWSLMLQFAHDDRWPDKLRKLVHKMGVDRVVAQQAGCDLYRSYDGENWLRVTTEGFGNRYNYGLRSMASTPLGLFVGTVNPFAPTIAVRENGRWVYRENSEGGLEIWLGNNTQRADRTDAATKEKRDHDDKPRESGKSAGLPMA